MPPANVTVAKPVYQSVQGYWQYNGYLETTEMVEVRARVKGFLRKIRFSEGTEVVGEVRRGDKLISPGDLLYEIDDQEYITGVAKAQADLDKANADVLKAKADVDKAKADEVPAREQFRKGVGSKADVDRLEAATRGFMAAVTGADAAVLQAQASLKQANIQLGYTKIHAKINGRINRTLVTEGNLVGQNESTLLTTIVRMDELYVYFDVPERDLVAYQRALREQSVPSPTSQQIQIEIGIETEQGFPHTGRIDFRENRVNTSTGTVRLRGRVPNPRIPPERVRKAEPGLSALTGPAAPLGTYTRLLYPGLYARVRVPEGFPQERLVIPEDALMTGQEGQYVYVVAPDDTVQKRSVVVGPIVWREPPVGPGPRPPGWAILNPSPATPPEQAKGPPRPSRLPVRSVVAIESGLRAEDRVIVIGVQAARPMAKAAPHLWVLTPPKK